MALDLRIASARFRTAVARAQVLFDFAFGTSVGASWFGASGIPRTREAAFIPGHSYPVMYLGRNSDGLARDARSLLDSGYQSPRSIRLG